MGKEKLRQIQRENFKRRRDECMLAYYYQLLKNNKEELQEKSDPYTWLYTEVSRLFFITPGSAMRIIRRAVGEISNPRNFDSEIKTLKKLIYGRTEERDNRG